jgi:hypothetical protein
MHQPAQLLTLCVAADEPWLWALLKLAPTPERAARLPTKRVQKLLTEHRIRRVSADDVVNAIKAPPVYVAPGATEAYAEHALLLLPRLSLLRQQRTDCQKRIEKAVDDAAAVEPAPGRPSDVAICRSLPGVGSNITAALLAEASQPLAERDYPTLRAQAGVAPVTHQTGIQGKPARGNRKTVRKPQVIMRQACSHRLRNAVYHWANGSIIRDPSSRAYYTACRQRGHSHGRAIRSLSDRLLRILVAMLKQGAVYDPNRANPVGTAEAA